jgi:hypothetical protein
VNHPQSYSATPLQSLAAFRRLVSGVPALRRAAAAIVGGDEDLIWLPTVAAGELMLTMMEQGRAPDVFAAAHSDNAQFAVAIALGEAGLDAQAFYQAIPGFVQLVREHTAKAISHN